MKRIFNLKSAVCLLLSLLLPVPALAKPKQRAYKAAVEQVYDAALKVIKEHHKVQFASKEERLISFRSGRSMSSWGFECNASVEATDNPSESLLVINVQKTRGQLFAWGAGDRLATDIFKWVQEELQKKAKEK